MTGPDNLCSGSSPLTRGKLLERGRNPARAGLIPAHAGKTRGRQRGHLQVGAHPRSRGENASAFWRSTLAAGSSPLTRGKLMISNAIRRGDRLIPAHAGKTRRSTPLPTARTAHPRSRGENPPPRRARPGATGSSPLTRGKRGGVCGDVAPARLIPAHAGKTLFNADRHCLSPAHPRSRGENNPDCPRGGHYAGSSPLTRGKPPRSPRSAQHARLIPAHAGKTKLNATLGQPAAAHPRSRGENPRFLEIPGKGHGSSPLTRGKQSSTASHPRRSRLIPAHAGKTYVGLGIG